MLISGRSYLASNLRLQLAMEEIHDDASIPEAVILPRLRRHHHVRPSLRVLQLDIGLVRHSV